MSAIVSSFPCEEPELLCQSMFHPHEIHQQGFVNQTQDSKTPPPILNINNLQTVANVLI